MSPDAIVHLFDWPFARCEAELPAIAAEGFGAIQISPPQLSLDSPEWWARYQPVDHTRLEGPLGDEAALRSLIAAAHALGLKVIPWTVNEPERIDRLIAWGVDGLISDHPLRVREAMARRGMALPAPVAVPAAAR